jgi:hypothetical protein
MIATLIGMLIDAGIAGGRVHPVRVPQGALWPSISVSTVALTPIYVSEGEAGMSTARVQVDVYATTFVEANAVARDVQTALSGSNDAPFENIQLDAEVSTFENETPYLFRVIQDYTILKRP